MKHHDEVEERSVVVPQYPLWAEVKPSGKNIGRRSYHSCVVWNNT